MAELPSGVVTFLFTDLEGSTRLWEAHPDEMRRALARHDELVSAAIEHRGGYVVKTTGDGFLAAFADASDAVAAAIAAQLDLAAEPWGETGALRVRIGVHSGPAEIRDRDYHGTTLNRASRLMSVGHGGQILVSLVTTELIRGSGVELLDLGSHTLRGLNEPEHIFQVVGDGLASEFAPLRTAEAEHRRPPSNLPAPVDRFVGRVHELHEVQTRLSSTRLLTLVGTGGTGKTRLAVEAARDLCDDFDDRVFFVDLSGCREVDAVVSVTARTVGVHEQGDRPVLDAVKEQIGTDTMLLVFDNFEQVTAAGPTVAELLRDCPGLKQLVTSREALHVTGEQIYAVPPLALPDAGVVGLGLADLESTEAVQLFVERARAVRPDFELTAANAPSVIELCVRLDGLPLAIELATARLALFSPQALVERLGSRLDLLKGGARDAPERQRALRDTISWSYELLTDVEQRLLALLSVFSGASLDAVEDVVGRIAALDGIEVIDALGSLVQKSLLRQADVASGEPRVSMLETIREFAAERLAEDVDARDAATRAHAEHFADWTQRQSEAFAAGERDAAAARMAADVDNVLAAWRYWVGRDDVPQLGKLIDGLWRLNDSRGWYHQTATLVTDLLGVLSASPATDDGSAEEILLQVSLARVLMASEGYTPETERAYQRALELVEAQGVLPQLLPVLRGLSTYYIYRAEFETSLRLGEQLLALGEQFDDARARVEGHLLVGFSRGMLTGPRDGIDDLELGLAAYGTTTHTVERFEAGNDPGVVCHLVQGMLLWMQGFPDRARDRAHQGVELATQLRHPHSRAYAHFHTGLVHLWRQEFDATRDQAVLVTELGDTYRFEVWSAVGTALQGIAIAAMGDADAGLALVEGATRDYRELQTPPVFWPSLLHLHAQVTALAGRPAEGLVSIDQAIAVIETLPEPQTLAPELLLVKGQLVLAVSDDPAAAEPVFARAVRVADELDAPMLQLRSTAALARLWSSTGRADAAREALATAYARLTEGFDTADLVGARRLLDDLDAR